MTSARRVLEERDADSEALATYVYGLGISDIVSMNRDVDEDETLEPYFYITTDRFDVIAVIDESGTVVERIAYDEFGLPYIFTDINGNDQVRRESLIGNPYAIGGYRWESPSQKLRRPSATE